MKKKLKAQIKFDFIGGFFLFIVAVAYISFSAVQSFPRYVAQSADNDMRLEAWKSSEEFMRFSERNGVIDANSLKNFSSCFHYIANNLTSANNYTYVKNLLNVGNLSNIHLTFDILLFGITNTGNNTQRNGTVILRKIPYNISVRNTSNYFSEAGIEGGNWSTTNVTIGFPFETYDISKIDYDGEFVILRKRLFDCGPNAPVLAPNSIVRRYSTYNGSVSMMELTYW